MKKIKTILFSVLALLMLIGAGSVSAQVTSETTTKLPKVEMTEGIVADPGLTRATVYEYQNASLYNNGSASKSFAFSLSSSYPYGKVWVHNTSSSSCTVSFAYKNKTASPLATYTLASGKSSTYWVLSNKNYGNYYCNIATTNGSSLNGTITIRKGTTLQEMGY